MKSILLFCKKILFRLMTVLLMILAWLMLSILLTWALTEAVSLFATERYRQGDTPHEWFSVAVYETDDKGKPFVSAKSPAQITPQDKLWQESEPYDNKMGFGVAQIGKDTYQLHHEIGLGMAYMSYRIENGRVVPLRFDHQWYVTICFLLALFIAAYCLDWVERKIK